MISIVCLPCREAAEAQRLCCWGQDYKCSAGHGTPRKALCVLGASCFGQVLRGSAPSRSRACSCASEAQAPECLGAAPGRVLGDIWQRPSAPARKTSRCCGFLLLSGAQPLFELCRDPCPHVYLSYVMFKTTLRSW